MQYVIGALVSASFFALLGAVYWLGRSNSRHATPDKRKDDQEAREKARKLREDFHELMSYDVHKAIGRKVGD